MVRLTRARASMVGVLTLTAMSGAARTVDAAAAWRAQTPLLPSNAQGDGKFGYSVAVSADGHTAVVGAIRNEGAAQLWVATVYTRGGDLWTAQQDLASAEGGNYLAPAIPPIAVAVSGDGNTVLVGAESTDNHDPSAPSHFGAAYFFTRAGNNWTLRQKFSPVDGSGLGRGVALDGSGAVAVVEGNDLTAGSQGVPLGYVLERTGNSWGLVQRIPFASASGYFEYGRLSAAVSGDGNSILLGKADSRVVELLIRQRGAWTDAHTFLASDGAQGDAFGTSVAISTDGRRVLIGAPGKDHPPAAQHVPGYAAGGAYSYSLGSKWTEEIVTPPNPPDPAQSDYGVGFGQSVGLSGTGGLALVTYSGSALGAGYGVVLEMVNSTWGNPQYLLVDPAFSSLYAASLSSDGTTALLGYPDDKKVFSFGGTGTGPPPAQNTIKVAVHGGGVVTSVPAGINCPTQCSGSFDSRSTVALEASVDPGWKFDGWGGDCSGTQGGSSICTLTMDADKTVSADFEIVGGAPEVSWSGNTPENGAHLTARVGGVKGFTWEASSLLPGNVTISHSSLPAGMTCAEDRKTGNPAVVSCEVKPVAIELDKVTFGATDVANMQAEGREYLAGAGQYVALGDSYSSGEGAPPFDSSTATDTNLCHRSTLAYAQDLISQDETGRIPGTLKFAACSGATAKDFANIGRFHEPPQEAALAPFRLDLSPTELVTISMGGNDVGFADIAKDCIIATSLATANPINDDGFCRLGAAAVNQKARGLALAGNGLPLKLLYATIGRENPNAHVLVVGYPHLFPTEPTHRCDYFGSKDQVWINKVTGYVDQIIAQQAHAAGVDYLDGSYAGFEGHELCNDNIPEWFNHVDFAAQAAGKPEGAFSLHPNARGQQRYADLILAHLTGEAAGDGAIQLLVPQNGHAFESQTVSTGQAQATFSTNWPGSDVQMSLVSPSGRVITRANSASDIFHYNTGKSEVYTVERPEAGVWTVDLYGADVPSQGESVRLKVVQDAAINSPPTAKAVVVSGAQGGPGPWSVTMDGSGSTDSDGSVRAYHWDFGDGTEGDGEVVTHTYSHGGRFSPVLTVTDDIGAQDFQGVAAIVVSGPSGSASGRDLVPIPDTGTGGAYSLGGLLLVAGVCLGCAGRRRGSSMPHSADPGT